MDNIVTASATLQPSLLPLGPYSWVSIITGYHVLIISVNPQTSPVIALISWMKQLKFRDSCCDPLKLQRVLPSPVAYYPGLTTPICFLHESRHRLICSPLTPNAWHNVGGT